MGIYSLTPFTQLDFPNRLACIIWFSGCNMRCQYCYNPEIVFGEGQIEEQEIFSFLNSRIKLLQGVVLSGGEATLYPQLPSICRKIKALGFLLKLDTNGCRPKVVKQLLEESLLDYVALDFKAPRNSFQKITNSKLRFESFDATLKLLCQQKTVAFEVRTTVHGDLLDIDDIKEMQAHLLSHGYNNTHYLQPFRHTGNTIGNLPPPSKRFCATDYSNLPLPTEIRS